MLKNKKLFILVLILPLFLAGCISVGKGKKSASTNQGGLFRSNDLGNSWEQVTTFYTASSEQVTFDASSITVMAFDPLDNSAIYLGTQHDGLFYSYNYGDGWFKTLNDKGTINAVVVDPQSKCTIYVAVHNTIYKTIDCSRSWEKVYFETTTGAYINSLTVSNRDNRIIYAGTSGGDILRSMDYGNTWKVVNRFESNIEGILVLEDVKSRVVYAVVQRKGIYKSLDDGYTWDNLMYLPVDRAEIDENKEFIKKLDDYKENLGRDITKQEYAEFEKENKYIKLIKIKKSANVITASLDKSVSDGIIYTTNGNIYRLVSGKYGPIWKQIELLTAPSSKEAIYSVLVNQQNTNEIFYGTSVALYHSLDNGNTWSISELPTNHSARALSFSLDNKFLYLGAYKTNQK